MEIKIEDIALMDLSDVDDTKLKNTLRSNLTVIAQIGTPALTVAEICAQRPRGGVVIVVTPSRRPLGILNPEWLLEQVGREADPSTNLTRGGSTFREVVMAYQALDSVAARAAFADLTAHYLRRPTKIYCVPGKHFGDGNPCSEHSHN